MRTRVRAYLARVIKSTFGFHARGDVEFSNAEVVNGMVVMTMTMTAINATLRLTLKPETAWLVGNRLSDAGHEASKDRDGSR